MTTHQPSGDAGLGPAAMAVRRTAVAVIVVAVALLVFAGGLAASRLFVSHDGGTPAAGPAPADTASPTPTAAATTRTAAPGGAGAADAPRCHTAGLRLALGPGGAAAGSEYHALAFTNTSGHTCRMYGYPGMVPIDAHGTWIDDVRTSREPGDPPRPVTLAPGATAWAVVHWARVDGTYHGTACSPGAAGLAVTPPDETTQLTIRTPMTVCGYGVIYTGAVTARRPVSG